MMYKIGRIYIENNLLNRERGLQAKRAELEEKGTIPAENVNCDRVPHGGS